MVAVVRHGVRAEEIGRATEERARLLELAARDAAWDWNLVTGEVTWTDAVETVFGYRPEEIEPSIQWWLDRVHPQSRDRVASHLFRVVKRGGAQWADEYPFRRRDGSYVLVFDRGFVVRDDKSGRAVRMVGAMVDHSRFDDEAQLQKSQGLIHAVLEALTTNIAVVDGDGTILATNEAWRRFARENGARPGRTGPGRNYLDVCRQAKGRYSEHAHDVERGLARVLAGELEQFEMEYPCPRGLEARWFMLRATPLEGRPGLVAAHIDITALKGVEWRVRCVEQASQVVSRSLEARTLLRNIAEFAVPKLASVSAAYLVEGRDLQRVAVMKTDPTTNGGTSEAELMAVDGAEPPPALVRALESERCVRVNDAADLFLPLAARTPEHLREVLALGIATSIVVPLRVSGRVLGAVAFGWTASGAPYAPVDERVLEEVAERVAFAVDNAEHYEARQKAIHARDDILAVVSHDLRNMLSQALLGTGILLKSLSADGPSKRAAQIVGRSTERMSRLVSDLLDFANVEAGRLALDRRPTRVTALVRDAQLALEPLAERTAMKLHVEVVGEGELSCDPGRVLQVLSNLVGNAVKFSSPGSEIGLHVEAGTTETRFSVIDMGPGIKPEDLPHVFERYWRGKEGAGCGLGLAIAKGIVEGHGGKLWVESTPGAGSTFRFTLPSRACQGEELP